MGACEFGLGLLERLHKLVVALMGDNTPILEMVAVGCASAGLGAQHRVFRRLYHLFCSPRTAVHVYWVHSEFNPAAPFSRLHSEYDLSTDKV